MEKLTLARGIEKGKLTRIATYCSGITQETLKDFDISDLETKLGRLNDCLIAFNLSQLEIDFICPEDKVADQEKERDEFESKYDTLKAQLTRSIKKLQLTIATQPQAINSSPFIPSHSSEVQLPRLNLPSFSGQYQDWQSFKDLFNALIHKKANLAPAQKLQYLKSCLKGDITHLLANIAVTDANYSEAWDILQNRFENKRLIVFSHLKALLTHPVMKQESAINLRKLLDVTVENLRALTVLGEPTEHWNSILVYTVCEKLDPTTRKQWEYSTNSKEVPKFKTLQEFLESRFQALESVAAPTKVSSPSNSNKEKAPRKESAAAYHASEMGCAICGETPNHPTYQCKKFLNSSVKDRSDLAKKNSLCFNCLRPGHSSQNCKSGSCRKCSKQHNTLLHYNSSQRVDSSGQKEQVKKSANDDKSTDSADGVVATHATKSFTGSVLLSTAVIQIKDSNGHFQKCRALLDSGSEASFISEDCVKRLGFKRNHANIPVKTLGCNQPGSTRGYVTFKFYSRTSTKKSFYLEALILNNLTVKLPRSNLDIKVWKLTNKELVLADPELDRSNYIDLLLGQDIFGELLREEPPLRSHGLIAQATYLGWIVSGNLSNSTRSSRDILANHVTISTTLQQSLTKFWELEEVSSKKILSNEEAMCEEHFVKHVNRLENGRFQVSLPFKEDVSSLGKSDYIAINRFKHLERRLDKDPSLKQEYTKFIHEYQDLNHMSLVSEEEKNQHSYYLPHHCVIKQSSSTTKLRVVFDGSARSSSGKSLNDILMVGPTIQDDLISIIMRFRLHPIALTADIAKMYRQISMKPEDCNFQRIVWRDNINLPMQHFKLTTVTYGTASAPFLAIRTLQELANLCKEEHSVASEVLSRDFYVDDLLTGADSVAKALTLQSQLIELLKAAGFELRKWATNHPELLASLPSELQEIPVNIPADSLIKTLGIAWKPSSDCFIFPLKTSNASSNITKRSILSEIAQLFDPLGWLAPAIVTAKIFMQELWKHQLDWDDILPESIASKWMIYKQDLPALQSLQIDRMVVTENPSHLVELHGFCDSSEKAYAAAVYIKCVDSFQSIKVSLIAAKTKVAPLKQVSLPRLELCGAVLLSKLIVLVTTSLKPIINFAKVFAWTDSTIVLNWLAGEPCRWKTFVGNRVSEIKTLVPNATWNHVSSEDNPSDCASRGIQPSELQDHPLWWSGPSWLLEESYPCNDLVSSTDDSQQILQEQRASVSYPASVEAPAYDVELLAHFSSLQKLLRVTAYVLRFSHNLRSSTEVRRVGQLSLEEVDQARDYWIKTVQHEAFSNEIEKLKSSKQILASSQLSKLTPFIDVKGILRVGGRLIHAEISESRRHPILLPKQHTLSKLIIDYEHRTNHHASCQALMAKIRQEFWIRSLRKMIRDYIWKCVVCRKAKPVAASQQMASLPRSRVIADRPFSSSGVDFAGPFLIKANTLRKAQQIKVYICLFVCFVTKALHLELVEDCTSAGFLASLDRFIGRRGLPKELHSDCGSNFVGASKELKEDLLKVLSSTHVQAYFVNKSIKWQFNVPAAPHHGGLWEAGVKSVKFHLLRILGNSILTLMEFNTLLIQIEAILNSRPLCILSEDPNDMEPLTPGHFLVGSALTERPHPDISEIPSNRLTRWKQVLQMKQQFWQRWHEEYLSTLQQRSKWTQQVENLKINDIVLMKDENSLVSRWPLAKIIKVHPGSDGNVRIATVQSSSGIFQRPVVKLCKLPIQ